MKTILAGLLLALPLRAATPVSVAAVSAGSYVAVETTNAAGITTVTICAHGKILVVDGVTFKAIPLGTALALAKANGVL